MKEISHTVSKLNIFNFTEYPVMIRDKGQNSFIRCYSIHSVILY